MAVFAAAANVKSSYDILLSFFPESVAIHEQSIPGHCAFEGDKQADMLPFFSQTPPLIDFSIAKYGGSALL